MREQKQTKPVSGSGRCGFRTVVETAVHRGQPEQLWDVCPDTDLRFLTADLFPKTKLPYSPRLQPNHFGWLSLDRAPDTLFIRCASGHILQTGTSLSFMYFTGCLRAGTGAGNGISKLQYGCYRPQNCPGGNTGGSRASGVRQMQGRELPVQLQLLLQRHLQMLQVCQAGQRR